MPFTNYREESRKINKRLFQILDEMNVKDGENNTEHVAISNTLVSANSCKQGGLVTMGVDHKRLQQLALDGSNYIAILLIVDKMEFKKQKEISDEKTV